MNHIRSRWITLLEQGRASIEWAISCHDNYPGDSWLDPAGPKGGERKPVFLACLKECVSGGRLPVGLMLIRRIRVGQHLILSKRIQASV